jgi:hypothetical protein
VRPGHYQKDAVRERRALPGAAGRAAHPATPARRIPHSAAGVLLTLHIVLTLTLGDAISGLHDRARRRRPRGLSGTDVGIVPPCRPAATRPGSAPSSCSGAGPRCQAACSTAPCIGRSRRSSCCSACPPSPCRWRSPRTRGPSACPRSCRGCCARPCFRPPRGEGGGACRREPPWRGDGLVRFGPDRRSCAGCPRSPGSSSTASAPRPASRWAWPVPRCASSPWCCSTDGADGLLPHPSLA